MSVAKYKPLMVIDDNVNADWASYIFDKMLESIKKAQAKQGVP